MRQFPFDYEPLIAGTDYEPACYLWIAAGKLLYVGETGLGVGNRTIQHKGDLNAKKKDSWKNKTSNSKKLVELKVTSRCIHVYYDARFPLFFNCIARPEFTLCDLGSKYRRLLEESTFTRGERNYQLFQTITDPNPHPNPQTSRRMRKNFCVSSYVLI